jgi:hypothetical protein
LVSISERVAGSSVELSATASATALVSTSECVAGSSVVGDSVGAWARTAC